jgi:hypothetical protein
MALASPGVRIKEIDQTATVQVSDQNIGVVAVDATKGPTDVITYISSERELVEIFGIPTDNNFESWFAASTIIQYGGVAAVIRPSGGSVDLGLNNANVKSNRTSLSTLVIGNTDQFQILESGQKQFLFSARTPGENNNGITVAVVDHGADQRLKITMASGVAVPSAGDYLQWTVGSSTFKGNVYRVLDPIFGVISTFAAGTSTVISEEDNTQYTNITGITSGNGVGAKFTITRDETGAISSVVLTDGGTGYNVGDVIEISGASIGGADPTDNLLITVSTLIEPVGIEVSLFDTTKRLRQGTELRTAGGGLIATVFSIDDDDVYASLEYAPNRRWISIAPQPGTSQSVLERGGKFDEFHILVIDTRGNVSGTPGTVLETLTYVSKASDGKSSEGASTFWKKVLEENSRFIYAGDDELANTSELLELQGQGTAGDLGSASANSIFKLFNYSGNSFNNWQLSSGSNYNYVTESDVEKIRNSLASSYDLVRDSETFGDIDFLVPGHISELSAVKLIDIAESRRDCMACISPKRSDVVNSEPATIKTDTIINFFKLLPSSSFAIFDSGYKYIYDKFNDVYRYVPCAADVAGICISTSINSETWFSPAGYNRGNLRNATKLAYSPRQSERDRLYVNRINPIVSFPGQGIVLFGDKTALTSPSAFSRINVRRLFIELEKNIANFSKYQLFEINDEITRSGFKAAVEPYLRGVQGRRGITDFLVICDSSNNTGDVIDRNELNAEIYIRPSRSINFITITFIATRTGVSFGELTN